MSEADVLEKTAEACYGEWLDQHGAFCDPDWARLTVAEREKWRRIVRVAWGKGA